MICARPRSTGRGNSTTPTAPRYRSNVWRALRITKRGISADAARIKKACDEASSLRALLDDFTRKGQVGRNRALHKLQHRFAPARVEAVDASAVIATWPEPRDSVFENPVGELGQNCIVINVAVALLDRRKDAVAFKSWCLEVPDLPPEDTPLTTVCMFSLNSNNRLVQLR
jgi:hypothetical protein